MSDIKSFRDLILWQKSMDLADRCYGRSLRFPREHQMVLGHEIRKSSVSIPSNVAEGLVVTTRPRTSTISGSRMALTTSFKPRSSWHIAGAFSVRKKHRRSSLMPKR